jgi:biopolymer transport protein ExbD
MELPLPAAESGDPAPTDERPCIVVNVLADGQWMLAGRTISPDQLPPRLQDAIREHGAELEVKIRADRFVPYRHVEPIMLACYRGGIRDVTYSVYRSQDVR